MGVDISVPPLPCKRVGMSGEYLSGFLQKMGVKGPRKTWKKRFFIQKPDCPNRLYYYISEKSATPQGFINLEEAISVLKTTDTNKKAGCFQINTPRRIYHLKADTDEEMNWWINGVSHVLRRLGSSSGDDSQIALELEQANNRISDLEAENGRFRTALETISREFHMSLDELLREAEKGGASNLSAGSQRASMQRASQEPSVSEEEIVLQSTESTNEPDASEPENTTTSQETEPEDTQDPAKEENKEDTAAESEETVEGKKEESEESDDEVEVDTSGHFGAKVRYDYTARKNYELSISVNETITVMSKHENGWWLGCNHEGKQGYFPGSYVVPLETVQQQ